MDLIPAIDLLEGRAVRLVQGDYVRRAASVDDPERLVTDWARAGVNWLHLVDLGGARAGRPLDLALAASLVAAARRARPDLRVELGGGLRSEAALELAFDAAIDVAVLGTAALEDRRLLDRCVARWPGRVAVSIDVRGERIALDGWTRSATGDPGRLASDLARAGIAHLIVTDVERDGTRRGPNRQLLQRIRAAAPGTRVVAAGGIATTDDLRDLADLGIGGAIVGLALVDGSLAIEDALAAACARVVLG
jgi:phosphoribosylformimino-5-aminoimidazole carboxamide ribotide isomerase